MKGGISRKFKGTLCKFKGTLRQFKGTGLGSFVRAVVEKTSKRMAAACGPYYASDVENPFYLCTLTSRCASDADAHHIY